MKKIGFNKLSYEKDASLLFSVNGSGNIIVANTDAFKIKEKTTFNFGIHNQSLSIK